MCQGSDISLGDDFLLIYYEYIRSIYEIIYLFSFNYLEWIIL